MLKSSSFLYMCFIVTFIGSLFFNTAEGGVSAATFRNKMLSTHNTLRKKTAKGNTPGQPAAKYMKKLKWDSKLANVAKSWSQKCQWKHNPSAGQQYGTSSVAENIYSAAGYAENIDNLLKSVTAWYNEYKTYNFQNGQNTGTTHYSIMMNADSTKLGCGYTMCSQLSGSSLNSYNGKKMLVVCNYSPSGGNGSPYLKKGSSAFTYDEEADDGLSSTEMVAIALCSVGCVCFMIIVGLLYMKRKKKLDMKEEVDDIEKDEDVDNIVADDNTPRESIDDDGKIDVTTTPGSDHDDQDQQEIEIEAYLEDTQ